MYTLPQEGSDIILRFQSLFTKNVFRHAVLLLIGTLLAAGQRTVCAALRFVGLRWEQRFHKYHRVLSHARWSPLKASRILMELLVKCCCKPDQPVYLGIDETIERRRGRMIGAKGIYRDAVRSSHSHFVKSSGLRWISLMLLCPVSWARKLWGLPFLTLLAPSERCCQQQAKRYKTLGHWACQMILQVRRWLPRGRRLIVVGDNNYAVQWLLYKVQQHAVCMVTRLRLDACLYDPAPPTPKGQRGRRPLKGKRQQKLDARLADHQTQWQQMQVAQWYGEHNKQISYSTGTAVWYHAGQPPVGVRWVLIQPSAVGRPAVALMASDADMDAAAIVQAYVWRWQMEVTFREVREHLGVETQRQWSPQAIARTTPVLLALFSIVTLWADKLQQQGVLRCHNQSSWYDKQLPTFSDAIAAVRERLWQKNNFSMYHCEDDMVKIPRQLYEQLISIINKAA